MSETDGSDREWALAELGRIEQEDRADAWRRWRRAGRLLLIVQSGKSDQSGQPLPKPPPQSNQSRLKRLGHTLASGVQASLAREAPPALPEPQKTPSPHPATPRGPPAPSSAGSIQLTATDPVTGTPVTRSARAWALQLDIPQATIRNRWHLGWSDLQCLGLAPPPARDRAVEQAHAAQAHTKVLIVEGDRVVPRDEAARRLGIKHSSLVARLRLYHDPTGAQVRVGLAELQASTRPRHSRDEVDK